MSFIALLLAAFAIMLASLAGVFSVWQHLGKFLERHLAVLVSFSAGVFLIVSYELISEVSAQATSPGMAALWVLIGAIGIFIPFWLLPDFHHHHDEQCAGAHTHSTGDARRILASDAIHNIADGILLAAAFAISVPLGFITALSILIHELVQEISEFFVLRQAGYSVPQALLLNFLVSATILVGALGGYYLLDTFTVLETPLLGIAAGAFLVVVIYDLVPQSVRSSHTHKQYGRHIFWFIVGAILMFAISTVAGHVH